MKNKHNQYVSIPNWFESQPITKPQETSKQSSITTVVNSGGGLTSISSSKLYELSDVLEDETNNSVLGAQDGSVLMYNGSHWYANKIEIPEVLQEQDILDILTQYEYIDKTYLDTNQYLTKPVADQSYISMDLFKNMFTLFDKDNNEITDLSSVPSNISNIRVNYGLWSVDFISALGKQIKEEISAGALYQLNDVLQDGNKVQGATTGSVLMYNGSHWYAGEIDMDTGITLQDVENHLVNQKYLKESVAHDLFLTEDEADALFLTPSEGDDKYLSKQMFDKLFSVLDANGNKISLTDLTTNVGSIKANYGLWSTSFISAKGMN